MTRLSIALIFTAIILAGCPSEDADPWSQLNGSPTLFGLMTRPRSPMFPSVMKKRWKALHLT